MLTVIIAQQEHIDAIKENSIFLQPLLEKSKVIFCRWNHSGTTLNEIVPELTKAVNCTEQWRAVIVCDEKGLTRQNPFDAVHFEMPQREKEELLEIYLERLRQAKCRAFDEASAQPLVKLVTYFCENPIISKGKNNASRDPEFAEYLKEAEYKQALREKLTDGYKLEITLPTEILCVAKRTCETEKYSIHSAWTVHTNHQYTRFYDRNLYFDKMRYLVFDILPKKHQNYAFDYIRFLYLLLLLANNEIPKGSIRPQRLYNINCETDADALKALFSRYEGKLVVTDKALAHQLYEIETKERPRLSDREVQTVFCGNVNIPVIIMQDSDGKKLYVRSDTLGLVTDYPINEIGFWSDSYTKSKKALFTFMKQPRRAVKRASEDLRSMGRVDPEQICELNPFQFEDIDEHIAGEELSMVNTPTVNLTDTKRFEECLKKASAEVEKEIGTRMTRKTTVILGAVALALFFIGFLPLIFTNLGNAGTVLTSVINAGICVLVLGAAGFISLLFMRRKLRRKISDYNAEMHLLVTNVENSCRQFSIYLSHACNVMRGYSVLNYFEEYENPESAQARILKKHRMDIRQCREELHEVFGQYPADAPAQDEEPYTYDFMQPVDYSYPIPFPEDQCSRIEFMERGHEISVPVDFVKRITVRMEELYD